MNLLLEHSNVPGTIYENRLICDGGYGILNEMNLHESTENNTKLVKFRGKFQEAEAVNKNQRMYPRMVLESNVKRLNEAIKSGGLIGECDHPTDSILHFINCSHKVTKLWWENNTLMGEGLILNTPMGKLLRSLIESDVRIGISSRGVGNGKVNEAGVLVIGESYKLITFDAVADPSTSQAFQERVKEHAEEVAENFSKNSFKNENSSIYRVSSDLILACLSGAIKEQTNKLKERIINE